MKALASIEGMTGFEQHPLFTVLWIVSTIQPPLGLRFESWASALSVVTLKRTAQWGGTGALPIPSICYLNIVLSLFVLGCSLNDMTVEDKPQKRVVTLIL